MQINKTANPTEKNTITLIVTNQSGQVLLLQRNPDAYPDYIDPFPYCWELIGGHVEEGEEPERAALRELLEETGIVAVAGQIESVGVAPFTSRGEPANNWIYTITVNTFDVKISNEHLEEYRWVEMEEALQQKLAFKHNEILRYVCESV